MSTSATQGGHNYCMQRAVIPACSNFRLSNVLENIHEAKVLQPMTVVE